MTDMIDTSTERQVSASRLSEGDIVKVDPRSSRRDPDRMIDGWMYGRVTSADPDVDQDIRVKVLDEDGEVQARTYVRIYNAYECDSLPWEGPPDEPDEPLGQKLEDDDEVVDTLATLEEEQQNLVEMQELRARTVEPGILELPVSMVTSAENSQQWAIEVAHPVLGDLRFFREKPLAGWSDEYDIVGLLESYGIHDGNPYKLQERNVFVELTGDEAENARDWTLRRREEVLDTEGGDSGSGGSGRSVNWGGVMTVGMIASFLAMVGAAFAGASDWAFVVLFVTMIACGIGADAADNDND